MALTAEMHNRGGRGLERDVVAIIERTCIGIGLGTGGSQSSGSPGSDRWEMTIKGPVGLGGRIRLRERPASVSRMR